MADATSQSQKRIVEQSVDFLVPGMELARDIYTDTGSILATKEAIVNNSLIKKLKNWNISKISIIAETTTNPITDPQIQKFFHKHNQSIAIVQKAFDNIRENQEFPLKHLQKLVMKSLKMFLKVVILLINYIISLPAMTIPFGIALM